MHRSRPLTRSILTTVVAVGMLVGCGAPDATTDPGTEPGDPSTAPEGSATPPDATATPTAPVTSPTRGDIEPSEPGAVAPEVLPSEVMPPAGTPVTPLPTEGASLSPDLQAVVDAAIADLEERGVADPPAVEVLVARPETFPNGALGCPKEGEMYTQALVDGYRVVLRQGERVWLYTAPENGQPRLCPSDAKDGGHGFVPPPGFDE